MENLDAIIVGAGLSGLSAAKILADMGINVLVLEATSRVGGRTFTKKDSNVNYVDLGGAYVGPTQDRILRMAKDFGVDTYKVPEKEDLLHYKNGCRTLFSADSVARVKNQFVNMDVNNLNWLMDKLGEEIPIEAPWDAPKASEWDSMTFLEFLMKYGWTNAAVDILKSFSIINLASEPHDISLLGALWYAKQCGGMKRINATSNGAQERKFVGGSQQISEKLVKYLRDNRVVKNSPVVSINQESKEYVLVTTLQGKEYKTKYVILACPPAVQTKIHFFPSLPPLRNQLAQRLPMGSVMKIIIYYKTAFWKENGICGTMFIEGDDNHPLCTTMDDTKPDGTFPAIIGFITADKCRRLAQLSSKERMNLISQSLAEATNLPEFLEPIHYEEKNWMEEQYYGGCYTATYPTGYFTTYGRHIRTPIDRVYFAGSETAVRWSGYMDGAIEAGERAAREILCAMGKISNDEIWKEEKPSTEVVAEPFETSFEEKYAPSVSGVLKISASLLIGALALLFMNHKEVIWNE